MGLYALLVKDPARILYGVVDAIAEGFEHPTPPPIITPPPPPQQEPLSVPEPPPTVVIPQVPIEIISAVPIPEVLAPHTVLPPEGMTPGFLIAVFVMAAVAVGVVLLAVRSYAPGKRVVWFVLCVEAVLLTHTFVIAPFLASTALVEAWYHLAGALAVARPAIMYIWHTIWR